jgi:ABC-type branched-subunit amino acid transport system ATPase component
VIATGTAAEIRSDTKVQAAYLGFRQEPAEVS